MKRLLLYSSLLISLSLPQTLLSRGYARTKIIFSDHSSNRSRKAQLPPPSRSRSAHFNHKKYLEYYHATAKWYQRSLRNEKPATILNKYQFYEFPGFQELIKTFPTYKEHIFATHKQLSERPKIINWLAKWLVISSPAQAQEIIQKMHDELVKEEKKLKEEKKEQSRIDQLHDIYDSYINDPVEDTEQNKFLSNRVKALEQSGNNNFQSSLHYTHWTDISLDFIQQFKLDSIQPNLTGTSIQHAIQQEFHDITKSTQHLWKTSSNNVYIQEFVTRNIICIKKGIEQNQEGNIVEAMQFADIAWAILNHAQAVAEGIAQGTINVAYTFSHPVETAKNIGHAVSTIMSILHRSTLEVTDMCILSVTDKPAAQKKLKDWEQNFTQLINTAYKQYQETPNRDITKFASSFVTEIFLTGKTCHVLKGFFSFARTKTAKLIQKAQNITESPVLATTSEGITAQVNKAVNPTKGPSTAGSAVKKTVSEQAKNTAKTAIVKPELVKAFNVAHYDAAIGDLKKLEMAVEKLYNVKGALGKNGPLRNVLECGTKGCELKGTLGTARGAMYELEKALELMTKEESIIAFGDHLKFETTSREFDIITNKRLIECKNINWATISIAELDKKKKIFGQQIKIAKGLNKVFEIHSKWLIPDELKQWFIKKGIQFFEG